MAPLVLKWRHLDGCDQDERIFNTFIDDLVRLSKIKQDLQNSFRSSNFF